MSTDSEKIKNVMKKTILKHKNDIWCPSTDINLHGRHSNTWFEIHESDKYFTQFNNDYSPENNKEPTDLLSMSRISLNLNNFQKIVIDRWMKAYTMMYNRTVKHIKYLYSNNKKCKVNFYQMRSQLKEVKNSIQKNSQIDDNIFYKHNEQSIVNNTQISIHQLDYAIKLVCANYKSAIKNLKNKNIKFLG